MVQHPMNNVSLGFYDVECTRIRVNLDHDDTLHRSSIGIELRFEINASNHESHQVVPAVKDHVPH